jgi:hypothetical protein
VAVAWVAGMVGSAKVAVMCAQTAVCGGWRASARGRLSVELSVEISTRLSGDQYTSQWRL